MYMEEFIHQRIQSVFSQSDACRQTFGKEHLHWVDRQDIEAFQLYRLREMIAYAAEHSSWYRDLKLDPAQIVTLADIQTLPFTTAQVLREDPDRLLCVSSAANARTFSLVSNGTTTGSPLAITFNYKDAERIIESIRVFMENIMEGVRLSPVQRKVLIFLQDDGTPFSEAGLFRLGVRSTGGFPRVRDCQSTTAEKIDVIRDFHPNIILGSAACIWRMTREARRENDLRELEIDVICITSEPLSASMRARLEQLWGAEVYHHYGMAEAGFAIGVECKEHTGFHFNESDLLFEVIDPRTGAVLPQGQEGELVLTTLEREGMPLIRYRTGDLARLLKGPCPCGAVTLTRISELSGRLGSGVSVQKGEN